MAIGIGSSFIHYHEGLVGQRFGLSRQRHTGWSMVAPEFLLSGMTRSREEKEVADSHILSPGAMDMDFQAVDFSDRLDGVKRRRSEGKRVEMAIDTPGHELREVRVDYSPKFSQTLMLIETTTPQNQVLAKDSIILPASAPSLKDHCGSNVDGAVMPSPYLIHKVNGAISPAFCVPVSKIMDSLITEVSFVLNIERPKTGVPSAKHEGSPSSNCSPNIIG